MNILLTNDDGIDAPGLQALFDSVQHVMRTRITPSFRVDVVAPDRGRSECGHSIQTGRPLKLQSIRENWHAVDGTPVDCVRVALYALKLQPTVILSGINAGANLGVNLMVSGTFAAAREACVLGVPAMAISHYRRPDVPRNWGHCPEWLCATLDEFFTFAVAWNEKADQDIRPPLWNVNLPAVVPAPAIVPPRVECAVDRCPIDRNAGIDERGEVQFELDFHDRAREPGRDVECCFAGNLTLSKLDAHFHPAKNHDS